MAKSAISKSLFRGNFLFMHRTRRGPGEQPIVLSRRGLGQCVLGLVGALTLAGGSIAGADARKKRKKQRRKDRRPGNGGSVDAGSNVKLDSEEQAFLSALNAYRAQNGLGPLTVNADLAEAAEAHSRDMAVNNFTGHTGSDGSGPPRRIEQAGYRYVWCGENVFWGSGSAAVALDWWQNSREHNENLLFARFVEIGIRRVYNPASHYGWYWTTTFGSRGNG